MKLSNSEKLILTMLAEIQVKLGIQNGTDTKLLTSAIYSNNTWALSLEMPGIVGGSPDPTPPAVSEVAEILDMWSFLEEADVKFGPAEKARVKSEADPFGSHIHFGGFDGNNEAELMGIARFFVEDGFRLDAQIIRILRLWLVNDSTHRTVILHNRSHVPTKQILIVRASFNQLQAIPQGLL